MNKYDAKMAAFTINNYTEEDLARLKKLNDMKSVEILVCQSEVGEQGTPHIQGVIGFTSTKQDLHKVISERAHFEKVANKQAIMRYCNKTESWDGKIRYCKQVQERAAFGGRKREREEDFIQEKQEEVRSSKKARYEGVQWKLWQLEILGVVGGPPAPRTIHWVWEDKGNIGKSFLSTYMRLEKGAMIVNGRGGDFVHMLINQINAQKRFPEVVIIDIPRSQGANISYTKLEDLSNGVLISTKYDSNVFDIPDCHKIVFANFPPHTTDMSMDRFKIYKVG